jgi:D-arabinose 1-dehydrogenase-like Zn-dependent alcohol dehydrogenase
MRVAIAPNMGCGICDQCVSGNTHLCANYEAFGINLPGGFAEYLVIPEKAVRQGNISLIPDELSYEPRARANIACMIPIGPDPIIKTLSPGLFPAISCPLKTQLKGSIKAASS